MITYTHSLTASALRQFWNIRSYGLVIDSQLSYTIGIICSQSCQQKKCIRAAWILKFCMMIPEAVKYNLESIANSVNITRKSVCQF